MKPIDVSVIMVNYNSTNLLIDAVHSIFEQTRDVSFEIIVVDNASPDNGSGKIENEFRDSICIIKSEKNLGFGGANNLGIKRAKGQYLFFLNPDTLLLNNAIAKFKEYIESQENRKIGAVGGILLDREKKPTNSYHFFLTPSNVIANVLRLQRTLQMTEIKDPISVDFVTGAVLFVPLAVINDIGGFDERFFMYCEEVDLEKRMADKGYMRMVIPGPRIIHFDGGSFIQKSKRSARRRLTFDQSRLLYIRKHFGSVKYQCFKWMFLFCRIPAYLNYHYTFSENWQYFKNLLK